MIKSYFNLPKYRATIFLVLALLVLYVISRYNYLLFHSLADGVSIVIAACVFVIIWNGRRIVDNDYFLYVGIAFLFFAFWDLMHLLGNKNMGVFPKYGNLGPVLYIVSRYILSISLIIAPLFINRKINTTLMYAAYSLLTLLILLSIFYWQIFPVCIVEGVGLTPFKVVSDYIICLILLGAIGLLLINRRSFDSRVLWIIVSSIILSIATGLAFTLYADPFGIMNAIGHFFQIASFYLIYLAFIETSLTKPQDILYQKLKKNEEKLLENFEQLNNANAVLEQEVTERKQTEEALQEAHEHLERRVEERTIQLRQEIEAHKRLQLTLRENEEKFRTVADWTYDWEYWIDPQDRVLLYISPSVERITGYAPEAFLADSGLMDRIVHPDDRSLWDRHGEENQSKTDSIELTFRIITASGEVCWLGHECQAVIAADGRPLGRRASNRDITRQKLAEEELRKSEERLQLAIQAADVGIFEFDIVNNRLTWDETMCRFYGITPDKFGGNHEAWVERIHPEDLPQVLEAVQRALRDEGKFKPEFRIVWPDGSIHWIKADARIERDSEGRALRVTGASLDITADKLSVEAAQSASRAKSLFIGNMSHELRTPLSAVLGMTDLLLNTPVTDKQRGYAETIRKSGKALLIVVSDILDFSKIEAGKMDL
ncbi:MAG: MASE3 domain-containing protein, partial [Syntrophales bacterium]